MLLFPHRQGVCVPQGSTPPRAYPHTSTGSTYRIKLHIQHTILENPFLLPRTHGLFYLRIRNIQSSETKKIKIRSNLRYSIETPGLCESASPNDMPCKFIQRSRLSLAQGPTRPMQSSITNSSSPKRVFNPRFSSLRMPMTLQASEARTP